MKRLKFLFFSAIAAVILYSCQKEVDSPLMNENFPISEQRVVDGEENEDPHNPKVKDIDILANAMAPIFQDYNATALYKETLSSLVIVTASETGTYYSFPIQEFKNVTYKVLTKFNVSNEMVELGIIRIGYNGRYLEEFYEGRAGLEEFKGEISSYAFDDFMSNRRTQLEDCIKIVFCDNNNSGGGPNVNQNPGNDDGSIVKTGGVIFINDDSTSGGITYVAQTRCGCKPSHIGGRSNSSCSCRKPNIVIFVPVIETFKETTEIQTRNDYWDCLDILLGIGLISDEEILAKRLKDCDLATEPYDNVGGHGHCDSNGTPTDSGNDDDIYPDSEFCGGWLAYRDACLTNNTETNDAWGHFMLHHNALFNAVISDPSDCVSTEEMEEKICVKNAIIDFQEDFGLNLNKTEIKAIEAGASCGDEFVGEAAKILLETMNQNDFYKSPNLQDFQNGQGDQDSTYLAQLQKVVNAIKAAGVDWYADFIQELIDCEEFETIGDLHDTWYMVKDFISEYNQFLICQREEEVTEWMLATFSPENVGAILGYVTFAPHMSVGYRAAFGVRFAQTAATLCSNLDKGYDTFAAFKQAYGNAGSGKAWHHIVEQGQIQKSGFHPRMVHNPENLVKVESGFTGSLHGRITGAFAQNGRYAECGGLSLRKWLEGKPFSEHYKWGLRVLQEVK